MFWNMFGVSYFEAGSKVVTENNNFYWLNTSRVEFDKKLLDKLDKQYQSKMVVKRLGDEKITYGYNDGTTRKIKLKTLQVFSDLTNGISNWYGGNSALDALYKVVSNSESALTSKNVNLEMSGKYLVGGDATADNVYETPLGKGEQKSIEDVVTSGKQVTAVKSSLSIERFVDNISQLELDKAYLADYYIIGKMYGIPKDVLEANIDRGAIRENQDLARAAHVEYNLSPKGEDLSNGLEIYFDLDFDLKLSWDHLLFMQSVKTNKARFEKTRAETIKILNDTGVTNDSINELLGIEIEIIERKKETKTKE